MALVAVLGLCLKTLLYVLHSHGLNMTTDQTPNVPPLNSLCVDPSFRRNLNVLVYLDALNQFYAADYLTHYHCLISGSASIGEHCEYNGALIRLLCIHLAYD